MKNDGLPIAAIAAPNNNDIENFLVAATPGGIEAQEKRGQETFANSATLPRKFNYGTREELETAGVKFGQDVDGLFVKVELPTGWKKIPTDHSLWSKLVDEKGRERASIFYKGAFYDRDAFISLNRFHSIRAEYLDSKGVKVEYSDHARRRYAVQTANGETLFKSSAFSRNDYSADDEARTECVGWLDENRPGWQDLTTYWDVEPAAPSAA